MPETSRKRHFAFIGFGPDPGGMGHVMINLMNELARRGYRVDVLLPGKQVADAEFLRAEVRRIDFGRAKDWGSLKRLLRYLEQERPDAVLSNREVTNSLCQRARGRTEARFRLIFRVGNPPSVTLARRSFFKRWIRRRAVMRSYPEADGVIAVSSGIARDTQAVTRIPESRIRVLPNPTLSQESSDLAAQDPGHPWLASGGPPVIVGIGRLARQKDFPNLLKAFARLRESRDARLIILGEGKERESLQRMAEELGVASQVDLPGHSDNPYAFLRRADLFVLSSAWEGSPNVLIEALGMGTPVVATDCPHGPREILEGGKYGPLVPVGDPESLSKAMATVLADPPDRSFIRKGAELYWAETSADHYLEVLTGSPGEADDSQEPGG
jgi:glycosyltransferase involved in cell wall biosynthesis